MGRLLEGLVTTASNKEEVHGSWHLTKGSVGITSWEPTAVLGGDPSLLTLLSLSLYRRGTLRLRNIQHLV